MGLGKLSELEKSFWVSTKANHKCFGTSSAQQQRVGQPRLNLTDVETSKRLEMALSVSGACFFIHFCLLFNECDCLLRDPRMVT